MLEGKEEIGRIKEEIIRIKKEMGAVIMSHNYMLPEVQEVSDFIGDSLELAIQSAQRRENIIVFCGVHFMAEGAKLVSPNKTVLLPRLEAGCFMADFIDIEALKKMKSQNPGVPVVCYINSDASVKAESYICCTSANAVKVVESLPSEEIIFIPDRNLGLYVQRFTKKKIILWDGWCNVHHRFKLRDIQMAREKYPDAVVIVHPECLPDVIDNADEVLSTGGMVRYVKQSSKKEFVIATEEGLVERIRRENPDKKVYSLGFPKVCVNMKSIRLNDVLVSLQKMKYAIEIADDLIEKAKLPIIRMLEVTKSLNLSLFTQKQN